MTTRHIVKQEVTPIVTGSTDLSIYTSGQGLTEREIQRNIANLEGQTLPIHATAIKAALANEAIAAVREHSTAVYTVAAGHMLEMKNQTSSQQHAALVKTFAENNCEALADNLLGINQIAARAMAIEVERSSYVRAEKPKHWWER